MALALCLLPAACKPAGTSEVQPEILSTSAPPLPSPSPSPILPPFPPPKGWLRLPAASADRGYLELTLPDAAPLGAMPYELVPIEGAKGKLLCTKPPSRPERRRCICIEPLQCSSSPCIKFDENVAIFERALKHPSDGRTVSCDRAETGACGVTRYFYFLGDIHRDELRIFGSDGRLVGRFDETDYDAYCEGRARMRWAGKIPDCAEMKRDRLLCGKAEAPMETPLSRIEGSLTQW